MNIFTDYSRSYIINSLTDPVVPQHFWVFSGKMMDYTLAPLTYLEETRGPVITIMVENNIIDLPASWYILVSDETTYGVDTVQVHQCSKNNYRAILMSPEDTKLRLSDIRVLDLKQDEPLVHPMLEKGTMLCYPLGPEVKPSVENPADLCFSVGPHDLASKYLSDKEMADILY